MNSERCDTRTRIEIGIARFWPDVNAIAAHADATTEEVHDVVDYLVNLEVNRRVEKFVDWCHQRDLRAAHTEHARFVAKGIAKAEMPPWVRDGEREYQRLRKRASKRAKASAA